MSLDQDIKLNSDAFSDAAEGMAGLKTRAEALKEKLQQMTAPKNDAPVQSGISM